MASSILDRKLDLLYLIYFFLHIPVMFLMDLQSLYPASLTPSFLTAIKDFHIANYNDLFFVSPPIYFNLFVWLECLIHLPVSFWAIRGLLKDSPRIPLILLPYALETFLTTLVCMHEYVYWPIPRYQKIDLTKLYGPYIMLSMVMAIDMFIRLWRVVSASSVAKKGKKNI
ncbi:hypothetical protein BCIN_15g04950 [Botrytis cinerea B05.10]|uniref:Efficient mitochondria targeting-associated protein 19 n=1 Tax=Botryotinia fuckeliana (strain B05.10) TaxID=332648 RepID=A0A384K5A5_BOTFB|nr:hypothetical protein BCIN_15g04950 [Botrytis cinerea B05.10]ATZ57999.1 hypothetical protein BCIN_15g04950 [Botrytis cinerea B05.10]